MRLSQHYVDVIKKYFHQIFESGDVYLFGSRVDDTKRGGNIDLYLSVLDNLSESFKHLQRRTIAIESRAHYDFKIKTKLSRD